MKFDTLEQKVDYLLDRADISDLINNYCYGMDSRDWDLYRSCWTDTITMDFGDVGYEEYEKVKPVDSDAWTAALAESFKNFARTQHIKYPSQWDLSENKATIISVMQGKHWKPNDSGDPLQTMVGYYRDQFVRTDDGWKITGMKEILYWNEGNWNIIDTSVGAIRELLDS